MTSGPIISWEIDGKTVETVADFTFLGSKITADDDWSHEIKRRLLLGRKVMTNLDSILKSRDITLPTKVRLVKAIVFPVWVWELDHKEGRVLKNWCFWTVVLEKTLESPLDCKEIQPFHSKENQSWVFIGRADAKIFHFLCRRELVSLGLSGTFLNPVGKNILCTHLDTGPRGQNSHFFPGEP